MKWLGYAWRVAANCFYLAVVLYVFDRLTLKPDLTIIVALLGIIYVAIRSIGVALAFFHMHSAPIFLKKMNRILANQGDPGGQDTPDEIVAAEKLNSQRNVKIIIDGVFLWIISIVCLLAIFGNLPSK